MNSLNKIFGYFIIFCLLSLPVNAYTIDTSVNENIRKQYNPSKLEEDMLPPLPDFLKKNQGKSSPIQIEKQINKSFASENLKNTVYKKSEIPITLKKGAKFRIRSTSAISDKTPVGTRVNFVLQNSKYSTLPQETVFKGEIINSHTPQLSGNGGLIVIAIYSIETESSTQNINAFVTKANHKHIFFNNIKGKRTYWKNFNSSLSPGKKFFEKMMKTTANLANDGASIILTPFSIASGVIVLGANTMISPVFALFSKGENIYIPAGSLFEVKTNENLIIYN